MSATTPSSIPRINSRALPAAILLGGLALSACGVASGPDLSELEEVPALDLSGFSLETQKQLQAQRLEVDRLLGATMDREKLADSYTRLGRLYLLHDLTDSAASSLRNALRLRPDSADLAYYLGVLAQDAGNLTEGAEYLEAVLHARPRDVAALVRRGRIALDRNELDVAQGHFERASEVAPDSAAALAGLGQVALTRSRYDEAVRALEGALSLQPEATALRQPLGLAYRGLGDLDRARGLLESVTDRGVVLQDPLLDSLAELAQGAAFFFAQGNQLKRRGDPRAALEAYRRTLELEPDNVTYLYTTGGLYGLLGNDDEAIAHLRRALALDPQHRDARFNLATALSKRGDLAAASQEFEAVLALDPDDREARLRLALVLSAAGRGRAARLRLEELIGSDPRDSRAWTGLARLDLREHDLPTARATLARAGPHLTDRQSSSALLALGRDLQQLRRHEEAIDVLTETWEADRTNWHSGFALAGSLAQTGDLETAAALYREVADLSPEQSGPWLGLASALRLQERHAESLTALEEGLAVQGAEPLRLALIEALATCPEQDCRDGRRALELAQSLYGEGPSLVRGEVLAVALAATGRLQDAVALQQQLLGAAVSQGAPTPTIERLRTGLERLSTAASRP